MSSVTTKYIRPPPSAELNRNNKKFSRFWTWKIRYNNIIPRRSKRRPKSQETTTAVTNNNNNNNGKIQKNCKNGGVRIYLMMGFKETPASPSSPLLPDLCAPVKTQQQGVSEGKTMEVKKCHRRTNAFLSIDQDLLKEICKDWNNNSSGQVPQL